MRKETYSRVIPRDFFNEAKLLKCMGMLALKILDRQTPCDMHIDEGEEGEPFNIELSDEGGLFVSNYHVYVKNTRCTFKTTYNSKSAYPFYCEYENCDYCVFDESGEWDSEFIHLVTEII
jgi:hypothetical protein